MFFVVSGEKWAFQGPELGTFLYRTGMCLIFNLNSMDCILKSTLIKRHCLWRSLRDWLRHKHTCNSNVWILPPLFSVKPQPCWTSLDVWWVYTSSNQGRCFSLGHQNLLITFTVTLPCVTILPVNQTHMPDISFDFFWPLLNSFKYRLSQQFRFLEDKV